MNKMCNRQEPGMNRRIAMYDTTLRDGSQGEDVSFSVTDKVLIARRLDAFGIDYIEGGWPGYQAYRYRRPRGGARYQLLFPLVRVNFELGVIMVIAVSCVKLLSAHNSTQHTSRKHKV
jgi:2-isopropylmalate synthase (EC 2.3.3.13)